MLRALAFSLCTVGLAAGFGFLRSAPFHSDTIHKRPVVIAQNGLTRTATEPLASTQFQGVLTHHNDNARTGQNLSELLLTPANVNKTSFGKLFSQTVDGFVYAQPLYVPNVTLSDNTNHNLVIVATEHDSVYAFDADLPGPPLWQTSFLNPALQISTVPSGDVGIGDIVPEIGITGTPVIDPTTNTLYVVSKTKEPGPTYVQQLHALDLSSGNDIVTPVSITASFPGSSQPTDGNGNVVFNALRENQRSALLLVDEPAVSLKVVFIAWASHGDIQPYHGWVLGYDAKTLQPLYVYNDTPNGTEGGIWQTGGGPGADQNGNVFVSTGNGTFSVNTGGIDYGDSFLNLAPGSSALSVATFFTPLNQANLAANDTDLGSGGVLLLPDQTTVPVTPNFSNGFTSPAGLTLNNGASVSGGLLQLTDGGTYEARSAFFTTPVNVQSFTSDFYFQLTNPNADGFTFTICTSPTAVGPDGSDLAYTGIGNSVAVKFDLYDDAGEGPDSTGLYQDGQTPTVPAVNLTGTGIDLHSQDIFHVHLTYDGTTLATTITDTVTNASFTQNYPVNIPQVVGGPTGMVGFTGATGGLTAVQDILSWTFTPRP